MATIKAHLDENARVQKVSATALGVHIAKLADEQVFTAKLKKCAYGQSASCRVGRSARRVGRSGMSSVALLAQRLGMQLFLVNIG